MKECDEDFGDELARDVGRKGKRAAQQQQQQNNKVAIGASAARASLTRIWLIVGLAVLGYVLLRKSLPDRSGLVSRPRPPRQGGFAARVRDFIQPPAPRPPQVAAVPQAPPVRHDDGEDAASRLRLANKLKRLGIVVFGSQRCGFTELQAAEFGREGTEAREVYSTIYRECAKVGADASCAGISGFPTTVHLNSATQYPGLQTIAALRRIAEEHEGDEAEATTSAAAAAPSSSSTVEDLVRMEIARALGKSAEPRQVRKEEEEEVSVEVGEPREGTKKEYVRGVAAFAPLNAPNMPGTAPMQLQHQEHFENQAAQGNGPSARMFSREPPRDVARQVIHSFDVLAAEAERDPSAVTFSHVRLPHSTTLTTGEAFDDKRVVHATSPN